MESPGAARAVPFGRKRPVKESKPGSGPRRDSRITAVALGGSASQRAPRPDEWLHGVLSSPQ